MKEKWRLFNKRILCGIMLALLVLMLLPMASVRAEEKNAAVMQTVEVGIPVDEHPELFLPRSMPAHGEAKIAVFLIEFPDYPNENPKATREFYDGMYFSGGVETAWTGYVDSVAEYYHRQSFGKVNISGQVFDWYTAKHERSYYDYNKSELAKEAAEYYRSQGVDFSQFDGNADGVIDSIIYHFAGPYSTDSSSPWYPGVNYGMPGQIGDMSFIGVIQIAETTTEDEQDVQIATACHELMHSFGMPDLYSEIFNVQRLIDDLMSAANSSYINPYTKMLLGWIDEVKVITGDMDNVRLDPYGNECDDFVIVTDEFNGIFDEFFLVTYKELGSKSVIYHIDARLNEAGTALMNDNQNYNPRPDKPVHSHVTQPSPHLFIEELSGDPDMDFVLNIWATWINNTEFTGTSVLGPNSMISSDTHDGQYTGIRIDRFEEHGDSYLTFDVSFVEDIAAPEIVTGEEELELKQAVVVEFNEFVYAGENFENIRVTDHNGNELAVTALLPDYPKNEMEIQFQDQSYEEGYQIVIPDHALRDSSGNYLPATILNASGERYLFPVQSDRITADGLRRDGYPAESFVHENDIVVFNALVNQDLVYNAEIEFIRVDTEGNILAQSILDNPANPGPEDLSRIRPIELADGSYIIFAMQGGSEYRVMFGVDANGELKWVNDTYRDAVQYFDPYQVLVRENGIAIRLTECGRVGTAVFVDAQTGQIDLKPAWQDKAEECLSCYPINLSGGQILTQQTRYDNGIRYCNLELLNAETYEMEGACQLPGNAQNAPYVAKAQRNDDGTIVLFCTIDKEAKVYLLDAQLNIVKSVRIKEWTNYSAYNTVHMMVNDGFCVNISKGGAMYEEDNSYRIIRYDRYLNRLWETDQNSNFAIFFKSPAGDVVAYRCTRSENVYLPNEIWVDRYGNENLLRGTHEHELVCFEEVVATCQKEGMAKYWYCTSCGCYFADMGQPPLTDLQTLVKPKSDHICQIIPAVAPTCNRNGQTEGTKCSVCRLVLVAPQNIAATGNHKYGLWTVFSKAGCLNPGIESRSCVLCGSKKQRQIPAVGAHTFGQWIVTREATVEAEGEETRACAACNETETRSIEKLTPPTEPAPGNNSGATSEPGNSGWIFIALAAVAVGAVLVFILLKKKK